jgi:hypothetical protein
MPVRAGRCAGIRRSTVSPLRLFCQLIRCHMQWFLFRPGTTGGPATARKRGDIKRRQFHLLLVQGWITLQYLLGRRAPCKHRSHHIDWNLRTAIHRRAAHDIGVGNRHALRVAEALQLPLHVLARILHLNNESRNADPAMKSTLGAASISRATSRRVATGRSPTDRPCHTTAESICSLPGYNQSSWGSIAGEPNIGVIFFSRQFPTGSWCKTSVEPDDANPVAILRVATLTAPANPKSVLTVLAQT